MKFIKYFLTLFIIVAFVQTNAQNVPVAQQTLIRDKLNLLTLDQRTALEAKLVQFDKQTSTQIAIITTDDIEGKDAGDYAVELGNKLGVGGKNFNNGVVFLVYRSPDNTSRKVFIATGKGLEDVLPDYTCSEIVNNEVRPYLKGGDYYRGLDNGVNSIIKATQGKYTAPEGYQSGGRGISPFTILLIIFLVIFLLSIIKKGGGGGGGTYMSRRGYRGYTGPTIWWTGGGGGSGSGWGGGGSSGGGFGGFGGGSFGGGGAGGDW
jgi:uncharacterized protein